MAYPLDAVTRGAGLMIQGVGDEDVPAKKLVYLSSNGKWRLADASAISTMPASGIVCGALQIDRKGEILLEGLIGDASWNWTPGKILFVSTVTGEITDIQPTGASEQVQTVGIALTQTLILFNPNYVLVERE